MFSKDETFSKKTCVYLLFFENTQRMECLYFHFSITCIF